jgi:hypothetical protein
MDHKAASAVAAYGRVFMVLCLGVLRSLCAPDALLWDATGLEEAGAALSCGRGLCSPYLLVFLYPAS